MAEKVSNIPQYLCRDFSQIRGPQGPAAVVADSKLFRDFDFRFGQLA
jgi:hypothetical protein